MVTPAEVKAALLKIVSAPTRLQVTRAPAARASVLGHYSPSGETDLHRHTLRTYARLFRTIVERARMEQPALPTVPDIVSRAMVVAALELTTQYLRERRR
jgi:hypothetical protein